MLLARRGIVATLEDAERLPYGRFLLLLSIEDAAMVDEVAHTLQGRPLVARALSLTYMVAGVVARSLPTSLNRTTRHLEGLRKTAAADRAELKRLQAGLRGLNKDTDAYRMAVARVEKSKLGLAAKGREIRDVTGRQRDLQEGATRLRGGLLRAGLVIGTVTGLATSLGLVLRSVSGAHA